MQYKMVSPRAMSIRRGFPPDVDVPMLPADGVTGLRR